ncbi:MAG: T9SS type A sorting domain-containing protein [Saprospiraceae bacterium]|nr:T9SS type A sorting domain-containing protein [Saprospiraceae bacterium]
MTKQFFFQYTQPVTFFSVFAFLLASFQVSAQEVERLMPQTIIDGVELDMGFAGGLNSPQLSAVDLNNDQIDDLYIFDRTTNLHLTFINAGTPNEPSYTFAPEYADNFPTCVNFVLMRDYNGDGAADIFAHFKTPVKGMQVFTGYFDSENRLAFEPFQFCCEQYNIVYFELFNGSTTQVFIGDTDYPVVEDIDGDTDLDILTWSVGGGYVEWYRNISIEEGYGLDSLIFELADNCWGKFYESSFSDELTLSPDPDECANGFGGNDVDTRHAGSTTLTFDADNDGDLEVLIGDIISPHLKYLVNGGDSEDAWATAQDAFYPSYDEPAEIPDFPAAFYLDLNNDGLKDLVAAPNDINATLNYDVVWFYQNMTSNEFPEFELQQKDFLVDRMLDFGAGSNPCFFDYNADGLKDILVGTDGYYLPVTGRDPRLILLENVGTQNNPAFELVDDDYLGMSAFAIGGSWNFSPAVGDLDNDGDKDLVIGEREGFLYYFENMGGAGNPANFGNPLTAWQGIDVTLNASPSLVDLNRDGMLDLVIGERNGFFYYFQNIGTPGVPAFNPDASVAPNNAFLGNVTTELPQIISSANAAPFVIDFGDTFLMFAGTEVGPVQVYSNIDGNLDGTFDLEYPNFGNIREGTRSKPALADINNDGYFDMVVGNRRGGLGLFSTNLSTDGTVLVARPHEEISMQVIPNPSQNGTFILNMDALSAYDPVEVQVYDSLGRLIFEMNGFGPSIELDLSEKGVGIYFCRILSGNKIGNSTLVISQ